MEEIKEIKNNSCELVIKNHMIWSMGAGFIPIPLLDFAAVSYIQLDMIKQLAKIHEVDFKESEGKAIITSLTSAGLAKAGAARAVKFIPVIGSYLGGVATAVLSGASTYAIGQAFKRHFETGGTFLDIDLNSLKKIYMDKFEKGKEIAEDFSNEQKEKEHIIEEVEKKREKIHTTDEIISKLKELGELKENGILTDEEFAEMKAKLLK
ncbi:MAG TPA: DUF697 domain-containing protein [Bacteroidetes bacterium]|nr:DUF697 domain-containing protein [Bacteroidota bacterium]